MKTNKIKKNSILESFDLSEVHRIEEEQLVQSLLESVVESVESSKTPGQALEEGLLGGIVGGIAGATLAPAIMKSICKILGIQENGTLGQLLTSKLVLGAMGAQLGLKM